MTDAIDWGRIAVAALQRAISTIDTDPSLTQLYRDEEALYGISPLGQGVWAGQIEGLITQLPHRHRGPIKRAAKATARTVPGEPRQTRGPVTGDALPIVAVQHPATWWLREGDTYHPVPTELLAVELGRLHPHVSTVVQAGEGSRPARPAELYAAAGGVRVHELVWEMGRAVPRWDGSTLRLPCCRFVDGPAVYSEAAHRWLSAALDERVVRLYDWVALHPRLSEPIAALYLDGASRAGKGLLISAIVALWGGHRVSYTELAIRGWTDGLRRSPIVHLDERAPRDPADAASARFRSLVAESSHPLTERYRSAATIVGCPRVVISSQGPDALRHSEEELSREDEYAIGTRILHLPWSSDAREYLEQLGGRRVTEGWCAPDGELVAHLRWVIETHEATPDADLLVQGDPATWLRGAARREGLPQQILVAVARAASGVLPAAAQPVVSYHGGGPVVGVGELHAQWTALTGDQRVPSLSRLGRALGRIAIGRDRFGATRQVGYRLEVASVREAAESVGIDPDSIWQEV